MSDQLGGEIIFVPEFMVQDPPLGVGRLGLSENEPAEPQLFADTGVQVPEGPNATVVAVEQEATQSWSTWKAPVASHEGALDTLQLQVPHVGGGALRPEETSMPVP